LRKKHPPCPDWHLDKGRRKREKRKRENGIGRMEKGKEEPSL
jgi:hypothetical protein